MFRFYSNPEETKNRVTVIGEHSEGMLNIAIAVCSKKDNFYRKKGRAIAEGRLKKGKFYAQFKKDNCTTKEFIALAQEISAKASKTKIISY